MTAVTANQRTVYAIGTMYSRAKSTITACIVSSCWLGQRRASNYLRYWCSALRQCWEVPAEHRERLVSRHERRRVLSRFSVPADCADRAPDHGRLHAVAEDVDLCVSGIYWGARGVG